MQKVPLIPLIIVVLFATFCKGHDEEHMYHYLGAMINHYNLLEKCYGQESIGKYFMDIENASRFCLKQETPASIVSQLHTDDGMDTVNTLGRLQSATKLSDLITPSNRRRKREVSGLFPLTEEQIQHMKDHMEEDENELMFAIGNLTCVMEKMQMIDRDGEILIENYRGDNLENLLKVTTAGSDPDFITSTSEAAEDCFILAKELPKEDHDDHDNHDAVIKSFEKKKNFFECMFEAQEELCLKWQMYHGMKDIYGVDVDKVNLGGHGDKYEKGKDAWIENHKLAGHVHQAILNFFWSPRFL